MKTILSRVRFDAHFTFFPSVFCCFFPSYVAIALLVLVLLAFWYVLDGGNVWSCLRPPLPLAPALCSVCLWPGLRVARFWLWLLSLAALLRSALLCSLTNATRRDASEQSQPTFCCATHATTQQKKYTKKYTKIQKKILSHAAIFLNFSNPKRENV